MTGLLDDQISDIAINRPSVHSANRLSVHSLSLHHFRNYESARLEVHAAPVVLTGRNGSGKTNILEALSLLMPGRGLRRAKLAEMDRIIPSPLRGEECCWAVAAHIQGMQGACKIGTGRDAENAEQPDKRLVKIDGKPARSQADLPQHMAMLWLTPQMEQLFNQGTSEGRKFLDRLVYNFDSEHAGRINKYEYAMRERNRLLADTRADTHWLATLEQTMAETACAIASARMAALESLNHAISLSERSFPKAQLGVVGVVESNLQAGMSAVKTEAEFAAELHGARRRDAAAGRTISGPHRSEIQVFHVEKGLPAESCSTGEQKALLLSIVLAQLRASALWRQVVPVLLLDEVVAHLDSIRKLELFEEICQIQAQVWMTGTDDKFFAELNGKAQFFQVDNGRIF